MLSCVSSPPFLVVDSDIIGHRRAAAGAEAIVAAHQMGRQPCPRTKPCRSHR
jgi:hypothetical protein